MTFETDITESTLEPKDWDEIYEKPGDDGLVCWDNYYTIGGNAMRAYDGTVYIQLEDGWVSVDEVTQSLNDSIKEFNRAVMKLSDALEALGDDTDYP